MDFLALRAVPGVEEVTDAGYRRTLRLPGGAAVVEIAADPPGAVRARFRLDDRGDLDTAVRLVRHFLDLDANSAAIDAALGDDPLIGALVQSLPGRRVPHAVDGVELAVRAVLGQQVSVKGARTLAARLVRRLGTPLAAPDGGLTHLFPAPGALATGELAGLGLTGARVRTIRHLGEVMASGELRLEPGGDPATTTSELVALPGIGPWTASYVAMRVLGDPDAFLPTDLGVRHALTRLGQPSDPAAAAAVAERWRPWRAYALLHLWG
jgi:AraC family transcriptional regulator of adaptative response / DNA-3-methyladenine glycosylase II